METRKGSGRPVASGEEHGRLTVSPDLTIDEREIEERFVRSSGPGGQNVNKVSTAVQIRFDVRRSPSLPEAVRERLLRIAGSRVSTEGILTIEARRFRTQERNRQDARARLVALVRQAAEPPKLRHATRPTAGSQARRLEEKRRRGETKAARRAPASPDD
jgi:ribosome-associated protein